MRFPATPGWVSLPVVVGVPHHSWLRAPGAVPRHSWLGSAGGGGVWSLATPGCRSWLQLPAIPGWSLPVAVGCFVRVGGIPCCVCLWCEWLRVVVVLLCVLCVCGVRVVGAVVWWCGVGVSSAWLVCVVACVCCAGRLWFLVPASLAWGLWLVSVWLWFVCVVIPCHSWLRVLGAMPRHSCLGSAVLWCWLVPCHFWLRVLAAVSRGSCLGFAAGCGGWSLATPGRGPWAWFPATPGWGPPVVVGGGGRLPLLVVGPGVPFSLALVCVCVLCGASCWCGWCGPAAVWLLCV